MEKSHGVMMNAMGYFLRSMGKRYDASRMVVLCQIDNIIPQKCSSRFQVLILPHDLDEKIINPTVHQTSSSFIKTQFKTFVAQAFLSSLHLHLVDFDDFLFLPPQFLNAF